MSANIAFNPIITTVADGSFNTQSEGYIQGQALDDPSARYRLAGGIVASTETLPMWGGVGIYEDIPTYGSAQQLGGNVGRATALTGTKSLTGFSVFDQNSAMINTPQSPVPLAGSGMQTNFYRLGSNARIPVKCAPSLVSLEGSIITSQVSWDFVAQELIPYSPAYSANTITGATWASTSGGQTTFTVSTDPTSYLTAGDIIEVSGVVSTGGTAVGYNGQFVVVSSTSSTIVVTQVSASSPGTYSSGGTVIAGGGALNVKILAVQPTNNMTVQYDTVTGFATWDRNGSIAVIQI